MRNRFQTMNNLQAHPRPDSLLLAESSFGNCINRLIEHKSITDICFSLAAKSMDVSGQLCEKVAESDTDTFLPCTSEENLTGERLLLISSLAEKVASRRADFAEDVYFDCKAFDKGAAEYLNNHPFVRKAIMEKMGAYLQSLFPYATNVHAVGGENSGKTGFYVSQKRAKVSIYRSDWFYIPIPEILDFIQTTVSRQTDIVPDYKFCGMVKSAGVGTVDLLELRTHSAVYRFCETNCISQYFDNGRSRVFDGMEEYRNADCMDVCKCRYKCNPVRLAFQTVNNELICRYLKEPSASIKVSFNKDGFSLETAGMVQENILRFVNNKLSKYGKTLPFQKQIFFINRSMRS